MRVIGIWGALALALPAWAQDAEAPAPAPQTVGGARTAPAADPAPAGEPAAESAEAPAADPAEPGEAAPGPTLDEVLADPTEQLQARLDAQQKALADQQARLDALQEELARTKLSMIPDRHIELQWEGHYRVRGYVFNHLYDAQTQGKEYHDAKYFQQRLWLRPVFNFEDLAKLKVEFRALDDVLFGDNASNSSTALFAELPSNTGIDGQEGSPVTVSRAWMEFSVPAGIMRVGRQPSDWGRGLLANSGDRNDHKFGTSHYASTNDRILFGTRPIAIYDKIVGKPDKNIPFITAIAVDRLVEDPLIQYYGFKCTPGAVEGVDDDYDPKCDADGDGVTDADHSFDEDRVSTQRQPDWWIDPADDVWEMVYVLIYRGQGIQYLGGKGDFSIGAYVVNRRQQETDSNVLVSDFYLDAQNRGVILNFEGIRITGNTRGIALPGSVNEANPDPLQKKANIFGYASEVGYQRPGWKVLLEHGYASGDDDVTDENFTGRPLNPDHNVGLLLYEEVLSRVTASNWTDQAQGLWSKGGVYNSRYIFPTVHLYPMENWELLAGFLTAWPNKPDGKNIVCKDGDNVEDCNVPGPLQATASTLGWEVDVGLHHTWHEHLQLAIEAGAAQTTDRLNLEPVGLNPNGKFFTFQTQLAYVF